MRRAALLLLFLLAGSLPFVETLVAQDKPPLKAQVRKPVKVAVLIGTNDYTDQVLPGLKFCEKDMLKLKDALEPLGFQVVLLLGSGQGDAEATRQNILGALVNDAEGNKKYAFRDIVAADDIALVAFSGHGQQIIVKAGEKETEVPFYCPKRAKSGVPETLVSLNDVLGKLNGGKAHSLLLVDSCRQYTERKEPDGQKSAKGLSLDRSVINGLRKNVGGMFACDDRQTAVEHEVAGGGHGLFFFSVLDALRTTPRDDDGVVTWEDLVPRIRKQVTALTAKVPNLRDEDRQKPQSFGNFTASVVLVPKGVIAATGRTGGEVVKFKIADGVEMEFCWIPPGEAQLGSPKTERDAVMKNLDTKEEPDWLKAEAEGVRGTHVERRGFWLGKYAVTQREWTAVMGTVPFAFHKDGKDADYAKQVAGLDTSRFPAEQVSWDDAQDFLAKVNQRAGVAGVFGTRAKLVLPHEDRWEYAYRGGLGNNRAFYWGDEITKKEANFGRNLGRPTAVGEYESAAPHPWKLCDMSGNVWQWCENKYSENSMSRVLRGGSWNYLPVRCRAADRSYFAPDYRDFNYGFRVCVVLD